MKKLLISVLLIFTLTPAITGITVQAAQDTGYGQGAGRTDSVNSNDYSTNDWDRFDFNYQFGSGADYNKTFGRPTTTDASPQRTDNINVQNNKDAAFVPPAYGVFSGNIETERSNPYFNPLNYAAARDTTDYSQTQSTAGSAAGNLQFLPSTSLTDGSYNATATSGNTAVNYDSAADPYIPPATLPNLPSPNINVSMTGSQNTQTQSRALNTAPLQYADGSIGTLAIPRFKVKEKVYEGETLANLKIGVAHFSCTSAWDGNCGICGHNNLAFKCLQDLNPGDEIIYTTQYGSRTYVVQSRTVIADNDYSTLGYSSTNCLTLITCVHGIASERYSILAVQKN